MNLLRKDIKNIICKMASGLDDNFFKEGFARRKNGLVYTRKEGVKFSVSMGKNLL